MFNWLRGKKSYLVGVLILAVNGLVMMGVIPQTAADKIFAVLAALGLMAVRAAINKVTEK